MFYKVICNKLYKFLSVRYSNVSLSPILDKNKKVKQHIKKKTHKPNALRFWVEDVISLYINLCLII